MRLHNAINDDHIVIDIREFAYTFCCFDVGLLDAVGQHTFASLLQNIDSTHMCVKFTIQILQLICRCQFLMGEHISGRTKHLAYMNVYTHNKTKINVCVCERASSSFIFFFLNFWHCKFFKRSLVCQLEIFWWMYFLARKPIKRSEWFSPGSSTKWNVQIIIEQKNEEEEEDEYKPKPSVTNNLK